MKTIVSLVFAVATVAGCSSHAATTAGALTTAPVPAVANAHRFAGGEAPPPSSAPEAPVVVGESLATNQAGIEQDVRGMFGDSQITSMQSQLTTAGALSDAAKQSASRVVSADSPVWLVTVKGNLKAPGGEAHAVTGDNATVVLSGQDGRTLFWGIANPTFAK